MELGSLLKIPSGTPGLDPLEFELGEILKTESRKQEMAFVNRDSAPELLYVFNKAYCDLLKIMSRISLELNEAVKHANKRKSVVVLEVAPDVLLKKGLITKKDPAGTRELRNAILDADEEYLKLVDKVHLFEATYEFLRGKAKGFEMAYMSVKKIFDVNNAVGSVHINHGTIDLEESPDYNILRELDNIKGKF